MRLVVCTVCLLSVIFTAPTIPHPDTQLNHEGEAAKVTNPPVVQPKVTVPASVAKANATANITTNSTLVNMCKTLLTSISNSGIKQNCTAHRDCMGACCTTELLAHKMQYNFSVLPCNEPSVHLTFQISDVKDAKYEGDFKSSKSVLIPHGNMSYAGMYETESNVQVILEKVVDITHFRLDFGVDYKVLKSDPLKSLFSHTLVPMLSLKYSKALCVKPTPSPPKHTDAQNSGDEEEMLWGVIPKEYVKDKTTLALIVTSAALIVVLLMSLVYFIAYRRRGDGFYRTYISTDENRHLTKGNDGFEPLDDSDID